MLHPLLIFLLLPLSRLSCLYGQGVSRGGVSSHYPAVSTFMWFRFAVCPLYLSGITQGLFETFWASHKLLRGAFLHFHTELRSGVEHPCVSPPSKPDQHLARSCMLSSSPMLWKWGGLCPRNPPLAVAFKLCASKKHPVKALQVAPSLIVSYLFSFFCPC